MNIEQVKKEIKELSLKYKEFMLRENLGRKRVSIFEEGLRQKMLDQPCPSCGKEMKAGTIYKPSVDHIIPKIILAHFGIDASQDLWVENLEVVCQPCNGFKSGKIEIKNPKTKKLLQELIDKI